jgi:hypothetical protein
VKPFSVFVYSVFFICSTLCSVSLQGQITGQVVDQTGTALQFCNVFLIKASDSLLVTGTTTDVNGRFQLEPKIIGSVRVSVSYIGYEKFYSPLIPVTSLTKQYDAGTLTLKPVHELQKVNIIGEKPFMEHQLDRTVFNIENSAMSAGNNVLEILGKLPGVTVSNEVSIEVRSKPGVLILIDGRTSYLSATDLATYLKSLDASQVEKIEVITTPSSKYDASGNAVINIILKKDKNLGLNAQVNGSFRESGNEGGFLGATANYRTHKFNFFGSANVSKGANISWNEQKNIFSTPGQAPVTFADKTSNLNNGNFYSGHLGADYSPDKRQVIGITGDLFIADATNQFNDQTNIYNARALPDSSQNRSGIGSVKGLHQAVGLNYLFKIDSTGKELSANADYVTHANTLLEDDLTNYSYLPGITGQPSSTLRYSVPAQLQVRVLKIDYAQPMGKKSKFECGLKASNVKSDNNAQYWNLIQGSYLSDAEKTNHFIFTENIYAGYVTTSHTFSDKLEGQLGVRGEETASTGMQVTNATQVNRSYFNLFPSAFLNWKIDSSNALNLS